MTRPTLDALDVKVQGHDRRLDVLNGELHSIWRQLGDMRVDLAKLSTRVAFFSGGAALLGAGLVSLLTRLL